MGVKTWSVTLIEEHRLRVFMNTVMMKIFGPKRDEVTGEWRRLKEGAYDLYCTRNIEVIKWRRMRWAGHTVGMRNTRGAYRHLVGRPKGKRPFGRCRHRGEDITEMDLQAVGCGGMDLMDLAQEKRG